ncbi:hypothetical protein COL61_27040 [Bacillus wiedmannii]|nr:hypothetical protein COL61_27040 [Bacillus wiedmannii]
MDEKEVLFLFEENEFHLVIFDIMLSRTDGWSVYRRIRKISNDPIITLTTRYDEADTLLGFKLRVNKTLYPPFLLARTKQSFDILIV